jgi:hypothetical protein
VTVPPDMFQQKQPTVFGPPPKMPTDLSAFLKKANAVPKVEPPASLSKKRKKRE